jgi:hypothetical protein
MDLSGMKLNTVPCDEEFSRLPLRERTDRINAGLEELDARLSKLRAHLDPIMLPSTPEAGIAGVDPASAERDLTSWLADYLDATAVRIYQAVQLVDSTIRRVDL